MGTTLVGRVRAGDRRGVPRRFLTLMPMLPSGFTSGRSLCVEPATPMSARGWTRGTRARGNGDAGHARRTIWRHFSASQHWTVIAEDSDEAIRFRRDASQPTASDGEPIRGRFGDARKNPLTTLTNIKYRP